MLFHPRPSLHGHHEMSAAGAEPELDGGDVEQDGVAGAHRPGEVRIGDRGRALAVHVDLQLDRAGPPREDRDHLAPPEPDHAAHGRAAVAPSL